nr:thioesterase family protein [Propionibacterium sp.]
MQDGLTVGATASISVVVDDSLTVPAVSDRFPRLDTMPRVFATAYLVGFAECAAMAVLHPFLDEGESSVGVKVDFEHTAATPVGLTVTAQATLTAIEGRLLTFEVVLRDDLDEIGRGTHRRAVIDRAKFDARVAKKADAAGVR